MAMVRRDLLVSLPLMMAALVSVNRMGVVRAEGAVACTVAALQQRAPVGTTITAATTVEATGKMPSYVDRDSPVDSAPANRSDRRRRPLGLAPPLRGRDLPADY